MPPVATATDLLGVSTEPIDFRAVEEFLEDPAAGARVLFEGVVRNHQSGRRVLFLEYEAYDAMAAAQIARIADEIRKRWPVTRVAIIHRTGRMEIGETAVIVGIASAHRVEAFEACRFGIDALKADAPIWKREFYADGTSSWQEHVC